MNKRVLAIFFIAAIIVGVSMIYFTPAHKNRSKAEVVDTIYNDSDPTNGTRVPLANVYGEFILRLFDENHTEVFIQKNAFDSLISGGVVFRYAAIGMYAIFELQNAAIEQITVTSQMNVQILVNITAHGQEIAYNQTFSTSGRDFTQNGLMVKNVTANSDQIDVLSILSDYAQKSQLNPVPCAFEVEFRYTAEMQTETGVKRVSRVIATTFVFEYWKDNADIVLSNPDGSTTVIPVDENDIPPPTAPIDNPTISPFSTFSESGGDVIFIVVFGISITIITLIIMFAHLGMFNKKQKKRWWIWPRK